MKSGDRTFLLGSSDSNLVVIAEGDDLVLPTPEGPSRSHSKMRSLMHSANDLAATNHETIRKTRCLRRGSATTLSVASAAHAQETPIEQSDPTAILEFPVEPQVTSSVTVGAEGATGATANTEAAAEGDVVFSVDLEETTAEFLPKALCSSF